jgi:hypothetical protein
MPNSVGPPYGLLIELNEPVVGFVGFHSKFSYGTMIYLIHLRQHPCVGRENRVDELQINSHLLTQELLINSRRSYQELKITGTADNLAAAQSGTVDNLAVVQSGTADKLVAA